MGLLHHSPQPSAGRRVFLAVPSYGAPATLTAFCLFESHAKLLEAGYDVELAILTGHCHVDDARNVLVRQFLASHCDALMFIDSDVGWFADDLVKLLGHDRDVVAAIYPKKTPDVEYPCQLVSGEIWADSDGLIEVEGVPTGFLKIKRAVLQRLWDASPKYLPNTDDAKDEIAAEIFRREIIKGARISGDYNFCRRWRALGGKIYADPEIHLDHVGERQWQGTFGSYLRARAGLDLVRGVERIRSGQYERADVVGLCEEWGNNPWAAAHELVAACIDVARQAKGPIIETGSGLTSLVMAATGAEVHALEHDEIWLQKVLAAKQRLGLESLHVHYAPLERYADGNWYGPALVPWEKADVVLCDGPPRAISNRNVLLRVMAENGCAPRCILRDDTREVTPELEALTGYDFKIMGTIRRFAVGLRAALEQEQERAA